MLKVLVADDQDHTRQLYSLMLSAYDCEILEAVTGRQALSLAKEHRPELIILDHNMPELTGYEVIQEIRKDDGLKKIPVILITGKDFDAGFKEWIKLDVGEFMAKPFTVDDLVKAMEKILRGPLPLKT